MPDVIVIGAGISGLTAAHKLVRAGKDVLVLEESSKAGGKIVTDRDEGYLLESGPNSLRVENQATIDLINESGIVDRVIDANPTSKKRFILKNGEWVKVPMGPGEAITTPLFSLGGKLRILLEPFIAKTKAEDESAASFVTRRLGRQVFNYAADPFITGIYAGDPNKLSMRYAFGSMWQAEQQAGSLIRGMAKGRSQKKGKVKTRVVSFPNGLSELVNALRVSLASRLQLHTGALKIEKTSGGYTVTSSTGTFEAPQIIFSLPAYHVAPMIEPLAPELSQVLTMINYPPVAVLFLGYRVDQFSTPPEGFGGLIPSIEKRNILGIIFSSSNFPGRAPEGHVLLTVLTGGAQRQEIANRSEDEILKKGIAEVEQLMKPNGPPAFQRIKLWKRAIPQYNVGYGKVLRAIEEAEKVNPGLHFIGNYRGGISMGSCIRNATELAKSLV